MKATIKSKKWYASFWPPERRKVKIMQALYDYHVGKDPVIYDEKTGHHYSPIDYGYNKALKEVRTKLKTLLKGDIDD
jgi:hypothetical protein